MCIVNVRERERERKKERKRAEMLSVYVTVWVLSVAVVCKAFERQRQARIVGGEPVTGEEYPFMVSFRKRNGMHQCAGTIIHESNPIIALTSAECSAMMDGDESKYLADVGRTSVYTDIIMDDTSTGMGMNIGIQKEMQSAEDFETFAVAGVRAHRYFVSEESFNDIALVALTSLDEEDQGLNSTNFTDYGLTAITLEDESMLCTNVNCVCVCECVCCDLMDT